MVFVGQSTKRGGGGGGDVDRKQAEWHNYYLLKYL